MALSDLSDKSRSILDNTALVSRINRGLVQRIDANRPVLLPIVSAGELWPLPIWGISYTGDAWYDDPNTGTGEIVSLTDTTIQLILFALEISA